MKEFKELPYIPSGRDRFYLLLLVPELAKRNRGVNDLPGTWSYFDCPTIGHVIVDQAILFADPVKEFDSLTCSPGTGGKKIDGARNTFF